MMNEIMNVVFIDPKNRQLFVAEAPEGDGYLIYAQDVNGRRYKLQGNWVNQKSYPTENDAKEALDRHVSLKRQEGSGWARWSCLVNGKECEIDELHAMISGRALVPAPVPQGQLVTLGNIEYRMSMALQQVHGGFIELGRCLIEAKEGDLVPHGRWESWVREHALMSERQAQRLMQIARTVPAGSPMARLGMSKIQELMTLPEPEREAFVADHDVENITVRQLREEIARLKKTNEDQNEFIINEAREHQQETIDLQKEARSLREEAIQLRAQLAQGIGENDVLNHPRYMELHRELEFAEISKGVIEAKNEDLDHELTVSENEVKRLRSALAEQEQETARRAESEARAKADLLALRSQVARGSAASDSSNGLTPEELAAAVQSFIGRVAALPHMRAQLAECDYLIRSAYRAQIDTVVEWCDRALSAINAVGYEVIQDE